MFLLLAIGSLGCNRIKVCDDVFEFGLVEIDDSSRLAFPDVDKERVPAPQHILDDARRADALGWIALVEHQFRVSGADIQNSNGSHG